MEPQFTDNRRWYQGISRYQWLVLIIASLGWIFDVFEGQIFVASMNEAIPSLYPEQVRQLPELEREGYKQFYIQITFGAFLLGGALGGVLFGILSDRIGRKRAMTYTILMYSAFTCVSALSLAWWHMAIFRFLVAMGVGGEWAVASAMVAEVFPKRARAWSSGIFHASSVFGTYLAIAAGQFIVNNPALHSEQYPSLSWRLGFLVGALPALLIIWVRMSLREPETWEHAKTSAVNDFSKKLGSFSNLFAPGVVRNTLVGVSLAAVGMATFWGVHVFGKDLVRNELHARYFGAYPQSKDVQRVVDSFDRAVKDFAEKHPDRELSSEARETLAQMRDDISRAGLTDLRDAVNKRLNEGRNASSEMLARLDDQQVKNIDIVVQETVAPINTSVKTWEMIAMFFTTTGGGIGLVAFGPLSDKLGRRLTFLLYHLGGLVVALVTLNLVSGVTPLLIVLPLFGFLTLGMHAGYAVYFPELFPTRLRGTGGGFCFNVGRVLAAPILFLAGWMQKDWGWSLPNAATVLSTLFLLGVVVIFFAKETRHEELPE